MSPRLCPHFGTMCMPFDRGRGPGANAPFIGPKEGPMSETYRSCMTVSILIDQSI
jgi:hypothetical protein